jgi:galactokinase/mevalonate kinase-like predicted kinase
VAVTIQASAPGRCGIVGNPSDIYGGKVLSCSIPARATCRLTLGGQERLPQDTTLWDAATVRFPLPGPIRVDWSTDIPRSSGLAGSTALLAATLACVLKARHEEPNLEDPQARVDLAELVRDIERHEAGVMCGYQDAYMVVHGDLQLMDFCGKHPADAGPSGTLKQIKFDGELPFLLVSTGVERLSGSVHGPMAERWLKGERAVVQAMHRLTQMAPLAADMLQQRNLGALAELMNVNQRLIAELGGSGEAIDTLIERCRSHGALAAKLAGAGMGGTVIALTEEPDSLQSKLSEDGYSRFIRPAVSKGLRYERPSPELSSTE